MLQVYPALFTSCSGQNESITLWLNTGDPRISWFQNSWSSLFHDSVSGTNFVNSPPFQDFPKKMRHILCCCVLFSIWILRFSRQKSQYDIRCQFFSLFLHNKKLHSLIRQSFAIVLIFWLLTIISIVNCFKFFLFLRKKKGLLLYANICSLKRDWSIVWILRI
jgi:hypothetical protein